MTTTTVTVNHYSLQEVARILGVAYWRILYLHRAGHVPEPTTLVGRYRLYTDADLEALRRYFSR